MTTLGEARRLAAKRLYLAGFESSDVEARALARFAFDATNEDLVRRDSAEAPADQLQKLDALIERRLKGEPLAYLLGEREFWSRSFLVTRDTLIPRPETELLVAVALALTTHNEETEVLDLGTGTGCILLSILLDRSQARGTGLDQNVGALTIAKRNAARLEVANQLSWIAGDWSAARGRRFNLVVSNPPYVPSADLPLLAKDVRDFEPELALDGGGDGLSAYRQILALLPEILENQGVALLEIGAGQAVSIWSIVAQAGLKRVCAVRDHQGHERVLVVARDEGRGRKVSEILLDYDFELAMFRAGI